jgi:hypothetical protein
VFMQILPTVKWQPFSTMEVLYTEPLQHNQPPAWIPLSLPFWVKNMVSGWISRLNYRLLEKLKAILSPYRLPRSMVAGSWFFTFTSTSNTLPGQWAAPKPPASHVSTICAEFFIPYKLGGCIRVYPTLLISRQLPPLRISVTLKARPALTCQSCFLRLSLSPGVVKSRRASRSSTPVAGRVAGRGGFDPHPLPPGINL